MGAPHMGSKLGSQAHGARGSLDGARHTVDQSSGPVTCVYDLLWVGAVTHWFKAWEPGTWVPEAASFGGRHTLVQSVGTEHMGA